MSDNRRRMPSSAYLRAEMTEASDVTSSRHPGKTTPCCCSAVVEDYEEMHLAVP